eukprot:RCo018783
MSASKLASNLRHSYRDVPRSFQFHPLVAAENLVCPRFPTPEAVLRGCEHVLATQIACEPFIAAEVRKFYLSNAQIDARQTQKGRRVRPRQPTGLVKLQEMRNSADFVAILNAQRMGLFTVSILIPPESIERDVLNVHHFFYSARTDPLGKNWNLSLQRVITEAVGILRKNTERQLLEMLEKESVEQILRASSHRFRDILIRPPYKATCRDDIQSDEQRSTQPSRMLLREADDGHSPGQYRVLACVYEDVRAPTVFVQLDENGEFVDFLLWPPVAERTAEGVELKLRQERELLTFICTHKPLVIGLATTGLAAQRFYEYLDKFTDDLKKVSSDGAMPKDKIPVEWVPDDAAQVICRSQLSLDEFPEHSEAIRMAVSIGRRLRDPLAELSRLFTHDHSVTSLPLHPLQTLVPASVLVPRLEQFAVTVVNNVGVHAN